jgi:hypothetical protein
MAPTSVLRSTLADTFRGLACGGDRVERAGAAVNRHMSLTGGGEDMKRLFCWPFLRWRS